MVERQRSSGKEPPDVPSAPRLDLEYDDFENGDLIARGGKADVYTATLGSDSQLPEIAVKEPRVGDTLDTEIFDEILAEAENWEKLDDHDHVVDVVDWGNEPFAWIAMEYMDGGHLGQRQGTMDLDEKFWAALAITEGVYHAHRQGVSHLDIKPENILFRTTGSEYWDVPKIADWGLSRKLIDHTGSVPGFSFDYAAPEQFDTEEFGPPDNQTDIFQLGTVLYELFTGELPFQGETMAVMRSIVEDEPRPPSEVDPDVPDGLDDVLLRALAKEKDDRYEYVNYLRDDLRTIADDVSGTQRTTSRRAVEDRNGDIGSSQQPTGSGSTKTATDQWRNPAVEYIQIDQQTDLFGLREKEKWTWELTADASGSDGGTLLAESPRSFPSRNDVEAEFHRVASLVPEAELRQFEGAAFKLYETGDEWSWRLIDEDGNVMADSGEEHDSHHSASESMMTIKEQAPDADMLEVEKAAFELFHDEHDNWNWRLIDEKGKTSARGPGDLPSEQAARNSIQTLEKSVESLASS